MNSDEKHLKTMSNSPTEMEVEAVKKILASLVLARKNFSLYPEGHSICMNTLKQFHTQLDTFLRKHGDLKLDIEKDKLIFQGSEIYSAVPEEGMLPFTLFRDGIKWLTFTNGIDVGESKEFLRIINDYSILSDEPEGDIVTALWEIKLPHIRYEVADFFWGTEEKKDFASSPDTDSGDKVSALLRENRLADRELMTDPVIDQASIVLTSEEQGMIEEMVRLEEESDPTEYLDALLDSLLQHREKENFETILEVLEEEFKSSLARKDFDVTLKIIKNLEYVLNTCVAEIPWAAPLIEDFYLTISSSQSLSPLQAVWKDIDSSQIFKIKEILMLLQPEVITTLGNILLHPQSVQIRQMLVEVMISQASRNLGPLESLIKSQDEKLVQMIVPVFAKLKGERPLKILIKLVRHTSEHVRQEAVKGLLQRGPAHIKDIFNLINDKDESIRRSILKQMGQSRDHVSEGLLLDYLEHRKFKSADSEHIISCFITLGQCGSSRSIPFLRRTLLDWGWMPGFWRSAHRKGAALALNILGIKEAQQILETGSRCLYPSVRRIIREVKKNVHK